MSLHSSIPRQRRLARWLALLTVFAVILAACGDSSDSAAESDPQVAAPMPADEEPVEMGEAEFDASVDMIEDAPAEQPTTEGAFDADFGSNVAEPTDFAPPEVLPEALAVFVGRDIIKTGDVVLEANDVSATTDAVLRAVTANFGAVFGQETTTEPRPRTQLTIRVAPEDFTPLMSALTRVEGTGVVSQNTTSDDVTEVVVDLDARITAAESSVARVQELLDAANDLNTIFQLEEELATREANLERLRGQRKTIGDQIALSTITVTIIELDPDRKSSAMEVVAWVGDDRDDACPGRSELEIGENGDAVLCVSVSNTGDDVLTDIDVQASPFRLRVDDFTVDQGIGTLALLEPGDDLTLFVELDADGGFINRVDASDGLNISVTVTATPRTTNEVDITAADNVFISADIEESLPGFGDSFSAGWSAMLGVLSVLMIAIGVALPFIPILVLLVWGLRKLAAKNRERADARAAFTEAYLASTAAPAPTPPPPPTD